MEKGPKNSEHVNEMKYCFFKSALPATLGL